MPPPFEKVLKGSQEWIFETRLRSRKQLNVDPESMIMLPSRRMLYFEIGSIGQMGARTHKTGKEPVQ